MFLNETANYAHVFLPGSTFLEKDGTFTNAERRIQRVTKVMTPKNGYADWEVTQLIAQKMGLRWNYTNAGEILDEIALLTPTFTGVSASTSSTSWARFSGRATSSIRTARRSCTRKSSRAARAGSC